MKTTGRIDVNLKETSGPGVITCCSDNLKELNLPNYISLSRQITVFLNLWVISKVKTIIP